METFKVVETFVSINGEGKKAGRLAMFIRLKGCNLNCSYCDTTWANKRDARCELLTAPQIVERIKEAGVELVTLTGGEPLLDENVSELIGSILMMPKVEIEIETNGSVPIRYYKERDNRQTMTMVVLPQAIKNVLPALGNEIITLLKETSVAGYVALADITYIGNMIRSRTYEAFFPLITVALIYLVIVLVLSYILRRFERRLKKSER